MLPYIDELKRLSPPDGSRKAMRDKSMEEGLILLRQNGIQNMLRGEITYQEIL